MYNQNTQYFQQPNCYMTATQNPTGYRLNYQYSTNQVSNTAVLPNSSYNQMPPNNINVYTYPPPPSIPPQHPFTTVRIDGTSPPVPQYKYLSDYIDLNSLIKLETEKIKQKKSHHNKRSKKSCKRCKTGKDISSSSDSEIDSSSDSDKDCMNDIDDSSDNDEAEEVKNKKKNKTKTKNEKKEKKTSKQHQTSPDSIKKPLSLQDKEQHKKSTNSNGNGLDEYLINVESNYHNERIISSFDLCFIYHKEPLDKVTCNFCYEEKFSKNIYFTRCKHTFCYNCMRNIYLEYLLNSKHPISEMQCPSCNYFLNKYDLQMVFSEDKVNKELVENILSKDSLNDIDLIDCINCGEKYENNSNVPKVRCLKCKSEFCTICHTPWHEGSKCPLYIEKMRSGNTLELSLKNKPGVVDLLISLFYASAKSGRTFELASPDDVQVYDNKAIIQYKDKHNLDRIIERIPSVKKMIEWTNENILQKKLKELDPGLYNLLSWIVIGSDNDIIQVKPNQLSFIDCEYYRVFYINKSVNESLFDGNKQRDGGSYMAYHGSSFGDWHSILRNGLKVMSNTKYLLNGASYGSGIYHSPSLLYQYCIPGVPWPKSKCQEYNTCCSVIEVTNGTKMPAPNENLVTLRYIILIKSQKFDKLPKAEQFPTQLPNEMVKKEDEKDDLDFDDFN